MGLDLLETFLAIEEAFEIEIPDADAVKLETPAKLIDYLCTRLGETADGPPLDQSAFYWLRKGLADELTISRKLIRPATTIVDLTARPENDVLEGGCSSARGSTEVPHARPGRAMVGKARSSARTEYR